jgi:hypothetical protein
LDGSISQSLSDELPVQEPVSHDPPPLDLPTHELRLPESPSPEPSPNELPPQAPATTEEPLSLGLPTHELRLPDPPPQESVTHEPPPREPVVQDLPPQAVVEPVVVLPSLVQEPPLPEPAVAPYRRPDTSWEWASGSFCFVAGVVCTVAALIIGMVVLKWCFKAPMW